jgi:sentrin-specific protease 1
VSVKTLRPGRWLSADVVDFFCMLIEQWSMNSERKLKAVSSTFLMSMNRHRNNLKTGVFRLLPSKYDVESYHGLFIPIIKNGHWTLIILKLATNTILYFDSMNYPLDTAILDDVQRFIRHRLDSKTTWTVAVQNVEKQKNSDDCGVFVCMFAMRYTLNTTFTHVSSSKGFLLL